MELTRFLTNEQYVAFISGAVHGLVQNIIIERNEHIGNDYDEAISELISELDYNIHKVRGSLFELHANYIMEKLDYWRTCDINSLRRIEEITR